MPRAGSVGQAREGNVHIPRSCGVTKASAHPPQPHEFRSFVSPYELRNQRLSACCVGLGPESSLADCISAGAMRGTVPDSVKVPV